MSSVRAGGGYPLPQWPMARQDFLSADRIIWTLVDGEKRTPSVKRRSENGRRDAVCSVGRVATEGGDADAGRGCGDAAVEEPGVGDQANRAGLGCSHMTVRRYVSAGGWVPYHGVGRPRTLAGLEDWIAERFRRHGGNADVVRQE